MAVKIFFCYAREDEALLNRLITQLSPLKREGHIEMWHDSKIGAGRDWEQEIDKQLETAQIILLLVSPDFIRSDYCYSKEMQKALVRHERGEAIVIPIILRPVYWQIKQLSKLQALPSDALPVTKWPNLDDGFFNVAEGIRLAVEEYPTKLGRDTDKLINPSEEISGKIPSNENTSTQPQVIKQNRVLNIIKVLKAIHFSPEFIRLPRTSLTDTYRKYSRMALIFIVTMALVVLIGIRILSNVTFGSPLNNLLASYNATATAISQAILHARANATPIPYSTALYRSTIQGKPAFTYPFNTLNSQTSNEWQNTGYLCEPQVDGYHVNAPNLGQYSPCMLNGKTFDNFAFQVHMKILTTGDAGGLIFRSDQNISTFYRFSVSTQGEFILVECHQCDIYKTEIGTSLTSSSVTPQHEYTLTVIFMHNVIYLYIDGINAAQVPNAKLPVGEIGLYAASIETQPATVVFIMAQVWQL